MATHSSKLWTVTLGRHRRHAAIEQVASAFEILVSRTDGDRGTACGLPGSDVGATNVPANLGRGAASAGANISCLPVSKPRRWARLRRDFARYYRIDSRDGNPGALERLRIFVDSPGLQAMVVYRFGSWVSRTIRFKPFRVPLKLIHYLLDKLTIICWGIHIDETAEIGGGFYIGHCGGVQIGPARIGIDCSIGQQVAIGRRADGVPGVPTLGDRVWVGAGSILFGGITIGDGATIGPLTVVSRNIPPRILVIGNPMKVLRRNYDNSVQIDGPKPVPPAD